MGSRKRLSAELRSEARSSWFGAVLRRYPTSPRKMRLVANLIQGHNVNEAINILHYSRKHAARPLEKLLRSAIASWEQKNEGKRVEDAGLYVREIKVDSGRMLKRVMPAPHGRAFRIMKRSNHVTLTLGSLPDAGTSAAAVREQESGLEPVKQELAPVDAGSIKQEQQTDINQENSAASK